MIQNSVAKVNAELVFIHKISKGERLRESLACRPFPRAVDREGTVPQRPRKTVGRLRTADMP